MTPPVVVGSVAICWLSLGSTSVQRTRSIFVDVGGLAKITNYTGIGVAVRVQDGSYSLDVFLHSFISRDYLDECLIDPCLDRLLQMISMVRAQQEAKLVIHLIMQYHLVAYGLALAQPTYPVISICDKLNLLVIIYNHMPLYVSLCCHLVPSS
jgi:hypothetical protein